ncbi:MAG: alpha/beta hydrolase [Acidimicrobiales bacterium]
MALDPQVQALAEQLRGAGPPIWEIPLAQARENLRLVAALLGPGEPVAEVRDLVAPGPPGGPPVRVRLYRPATEPPAGRPLPAVVYCHGGGFVMGDLDTHDRECRALANRSGALVASVDYRLAPEHPFPAALDDAWAALGWAAAGGDGAIDPARLAVGGDSAGANLAAVLAVLARDHGLALRHQLLVYPAVDGPGDYPSRQEHADGLVLTTEMIDWFTAQYVGEALDDPLLAEDFRLAPIRAASHAGVAPALVITAECDPLRDEGEAYAAKLAADGVAVALSRYPGMVHGFFSLAPLFDASVRALDEAGAALAAALAP